MSKNVTAANSSNIMGGGGNPSTSSLNNVQEFSVRAPKNIPKHYSVMRFNGALNVDFTKWSNVKMIREDNMKFHKNSNTYVHDEDLPKFGAGSEFGRDAREEARRKKYGMVKKKYNANDQPWILKAVANDKDNKDIKISKKYKGLREGGVSENASFYIFTQATDGQFEVFPVEQWYNFTPIQTYKALSAEEAEEEFGKRNKVMNLFSVMVRKRMKKDEDEDEGGGGGGGGGSKKRGKGDLKVSEMEDWEESDKESEGEDGDDKEKKNKGKKKPKPRKKKKDDSDSEFEEDSDDGDEEGRELDYITDTSETESETEKEKPELQGVEQEEGLLNLLESGSSSEEDEEKKKENEKEGEENEDTPDKPNTKEKKKKKKMPSEVGSDNEQKKETTEADVKVKVEASSTAEETKETAVEEGAGAGIKRKLAEQSTSGSHKKAKLEVSPQLLAAAIAEGITEDAVRRYLLRKPMTATELLQKFKSKKTKLSSQDLVNVIASFLKNINPAKRTQNQKMYLYLKN